MRIINCLILIFIFFLFLSPVSASVVKANYEIIEEGVLVELYFDEVSDFDWSQ